MELSTNRLPSFTLPPGESASQGRRGQTQRSRTATWFNPASDAVWCVDRLAATQQSEPQPSCLVSLTYIVKSAVSRCGRFFCSERIKFQFRTFCIQLGLDFCLTGTDTSTNTPVAPLLGSIPYRPRDVHQGRVSFLRLPKRFRPFIFGDVGTPNSSGAPV